MATPKKILVAYDGSPHSKAALDWGLLFGALGGAELGIVKVFEPLLRHYTRSDLGITPEMAGRFAEMEQADRKMLEDVKASCEKIGAVKVRVDLLKGHVAAKLLDFAREQGFELIVAGTKGHGMLEEMLVGSVTSSLVSLARVPVMVVKEKRDAISLQKLVVAYDGSDFAKAALDLALDIGKHAGAKITVVKVIDPLDITMLFGMASTGSEEKLRRTITKLNDLEEQALKEAEAAAKDKGVEIRTELLPSGNIADQIIRYTVENKADMIVAGTLGHGLLGELLVGSVTRNLISLSKVPVLVVKT